MSSLLATVLAAVRPGSMSYDLDDVEAEPDASASTSQTPLQEATLPGGNMSLSQTVAGIAALDPVTAPAASALAVVTSVMSAESIKGDAGRMSAAIALMALAPALAADSIVAFVAEHVPAAASAAIEPAAPVATEAAVATQVAGTPATMSYGESRVAAAQLAMPNASQQGEDPVKRILGNYGAVTGNAAKR